MYDASAQTWRMPTTPLAANLKDPKNQQITKSQAEDAALGKTPWVF